MKKLPEGYEVRVVDPTGGAEGGRFIKLVPYFRGRPIGRGHYPDIWGYWCSLRSARRIIRLHHRYNVQ